MNYEEKFWSKVLKTDSCWIWTKCKTKQGYGKVRWNGKTMIASRVSWVITFGDIPEGQCVLHNCPNGDNPSCVRPDHLWLGSPKDNTQDALGKGQMAIGERHARSKIDEKQVLEMCHLYEFERLSQRQIGELYGLSAHQVSCILNGSFWKKVERAPVSIRRVVGDNHHQRKLSSHEVQQIRALHESKAFNQIQLGVQFGVCPSTISAIINCKIWKEI